MIVNAQKLGRTRTCAAQDCGEDAEPHWTLCGRHDRMLRRGIIVTLHVTPPPIPDKLRCTGCNRWKLDAEFPFKPAGHRSSGGRDAARRGRYCFCHLCCDPTVAAIRQWKDARKNQARRRKSA